LPLRKAVFEQSTFQDVVIQQRQTLLTTAGNKLGVV